MDPQAEEGSELFDNTFFKYSGDVECRATHMLHCDTVRTPCSFASALYGALLSPCPVCGLWVWLQYYHIWQVECNSGKMIDIRCTVAWKCELGYFMSPTPLNRPVRVACVYIIL